MKLRTVQINRNGSPLTINATDFRYGSDVLWGEEVKESKPEEPEPVKANVKVSHKGGGRWIVEVNGHPAHDGLLDKASAQALAAQY